MPDMENTPGFKQFIIHEQADGSWEIEYRTLGSIYPPTKYSTARGLVARMAQLLDVSGPIYPQAWPENIEVKL